MKFTALTLFLGSFLILPQTHAGLCLEEKCLTLAQAGLQTAIERTYQIEPEVIQELEILTNKIPLYFKPREFLTKTLSNFRTFRMAQENSSLRFWLFKKKYVKALRDPKVVSKTVAVLAVSDTVSTYILPEFEKVSPREKALTLVREMVLREKRGDLEAAHLLVKEIESVVETVERQAPDSVDTWKLNGILFKMGFMNERQQTENYLKPIFDKHNNQMEFEQFADSPADDYIFLGYTLRREKTRELRGYHPDAEKVLTGLRTHITFVSLRDVYGLQQGEWKILGDQVKATCKENPSIQGAVMMFSLMPLYANYRILRVYCSMNISFKDGNFIR